MRRATKGGKNENNKKMLGQEPAYDFKNIEKEEVMFFDIETTGLSAHNSVIYLIGAVYYQDAKWQFIQWFANDSEDEAKIISAFFEILAQKKYIINYNGNGFDIPYIKKKIKQLKLNFTFDTVESIDLYKTCKKYKDILNLENCKLKTLEKYFGIYREDRYTGKELIDTYKEYIKIYALERLQENDNNSSSKKSDHLLEILLLHNEEDIINLLEVMRIKCLDDLFEGQVYYKEHKINNDCLTLKYEIDMKNFFTIKNKCIKIEKGITIITLDSKELKIETGIYNGELKFFYPDYKNYYYLPKEDTAMHKSIATFVDREHREQAKASNCYIRKQGEYVKAFGDMDLFVFKQVYEETTRYYMLEDINKKNKFDYYGKMVLENMLS